MSCAAIPPALLLPQVLAKLQQGRERVAHGWPSIPQALASGPGASVEARLDAARARPSPGTYVSPWVTVLAECLRRVEEARALWAGAPDTMPPLSDELSPCALELRVHLASARACAEKKLAWSDEGGLSRPQALCVLHLAVTLAKWEAQQQRATAASVAFELTPPPPRARPEPKPRRPAHEDAGPRSLRDLAHVASAFDVWDGKEDVP
ncbi:hypothetical protein JQX13_38815 [Archangium violaceum]|uniref:hypothetical protein n=1 Tax=Archangium violaceum TaxID=83451 RepID=UPI00193C3805|nr:hypothetical protein [Archangium violaceum]QRK06036.1 hypothetical protein JQX13_38815 [Archangium violaceum]